MKPAEDRLKIRVYSPYQTFFEGSAVSISAINKTGPFDILYGHASFLSLLMAGRVTVNTGFDSIPIEIESGILRVKDNDVTLFANV